MPLLKLCTSCGGMHAHSVGKCQRGRTKPKTQASKFRDQRRWKAKSTAVRERDHYLCQICIIEAYDTYLQYNSNQLEVNHIIPLEQDITLGFEETNLITLCTTHHKLADAGGIPKKLMQDLATLPRDYEKIKATLSQGGYPPGPNIESG